MKARDLMKMVEADHAPSMMVMQPNFRAPGGQEVAFKCSCGWKTSRMENIDFAIAYPEVSMALRNQWLHQEMTEHLLDQEIDVEDVLHAIEKGVLA